MQAVVTEEPLRRVCSAVPVAALASAKVLSVWAPSTIAPAATPRKQHHGRFSFENLVPTLDLRLWKTTPEAPFDQLESETARGKRAGYNLNNSIVESRNHFD